MKPSTRLLILFTATVAALAMTGTVLASTLYAPVYGTSPDQVTAFRSASDGSLSPLAGSPFPIGMGPGGGAIGFAFTPDGRRAAISYLFDGGVRGLSEFIDGVFEPAQPTIVTEPSEATSIAISPDGRFAYVPMRDGVAGIRVYSIDAYGGLTEISGSPFAAGNSYYDIAVTPDGLHLYTTGTGTSIDRFQVNADGSLTTLGSTSFGGAAYLQTSPDNRFLFVGTLGVGESTVASFSVAADGGLTLLGAPVPMGDSSLGYFGVTPDGGHIYAPESNQDVVITIVVAPDGTLSAVGAPTPVVDAESVAVSPDGRFLYAGRPGPGEIAFAAIGADGRPATFADTATWPSGEPERLVFRPAQAPHASLRGRATEPGLASAFGLADPTNMFFRSAKFDWNFGDGMSATTDIGQAQHVFARAGVYAVKLTVTNEENCSDHLIYTGQSTLCNGGPSATITRRFDTPPGVSSLKVAPSKFRPAPARRAKAGAKRGARVSYRLSENAMVSVTIQRPAVGRWVDNLCRKATRKNLGKKKCRLWAPVGATLRLNVKAGANAYKFGGRVGRKTLRPGRYRVRMIARDAAKGESVPRTAGFTIQR